MQNDRREIVNGCVMWIVILILCTGMPVLSIIVENTTGFHLRHVQAFQPYLSLAVGAIWIGGSVGILAWVMKALEGSSGAGRPDGDNATSLDRGAGTMSWDDAGEGSE